MFTEIHGMVHGLHRILNGNASGKKESAKMRPSVGCLKHVRTAKKPNWLRLTIFTLVLVGTV
jgi:hypothetical protein